MLAHGGAIPTSTLVSILAGLDEFERDLILARTSDGQNSCECQGRAFRQAPGSDRPPARRGPCDWRKAKHKQTLRGALRSARPPYRGLLRALSEARAPEPPRRRAQGAIHRSIARHKKGALSCQTDRDCQSLRRPCCAQRSALGASKRHRRFPDGPGKDTFVAVCGGCHDINRARAGYTPAGWNTLQHMMQNFGTPIAPEDWPTVTAYLIKAFPERPRPPAAIIAGPVEASIKLWDVPTLGSRPHDPVATKDGAIWWTGQLVQQAWPCRSEERHDPGIYSQDAAHRTAWPGRGQGRQHLVHRQPRRADRQARSPDRHHHRIQDPGPEGEGSRTASRSRPTGYSGSPRSNPTQSVASTPRPARSSFVTMPTPRSRPYGIIVSPKGIPTLCLFGTNKLATIDPNTMEIKEYALPDAASRPRRIAIVGDEVWYSDFSRGFLGRYNLATGAA